MDSNLIYYHCKELFIFKILIRKVNIKCFVMTNEYYPLICQEKELRRK